MRRKILYFGAAGAATLIAWGIYVKVPTAVETVVARPDTVVARPLETSDSSTQTNPFDEDLGGQASHSEAADKNSQTLSLIEPLFEGLATNLTNEEFEELSKRIVADARRRGINDKDLLAYVMSHYAKSLPFFAFTIIENLDGIGRSEACSIIRHVASQDLDLAVELTLRFGSGRRFEEAARALLESSDPLDRKLTDRIHEIRSKYEDPEDLRVVDSLLSSWLEDNAAKLSKETLVQICDPNLSGARASEKAWLILWAGEKQTPQSAINFLEAAPDAVPSSLLFKMVRDLTDSQTQMKEIVRVGDTLRNDAKTSFLKALTFSGYYFKDNLMEISDYVYLNRDLILKSGYFSVNLTNLDHNEWLSAIASYDTESRDLVLSMAAQFCLDNQKRDDALFAINQIQNENQKKQLLKEAVKTKGN